MRWGILAPGQISWKFVEDLKNHVPEATVTAVGSRDEGRARHFADHFGIPNAFGSYEALAACPDVDVVYVASPHSEHRDHTLLCLEHGKAVLCEKAFATNTRQVDEMTDAARSRNLFLMEAVWTRFLPATLQVEKWLQEERIGKVVSLQADFGFRADYDPHSRLFDPALNGGSLYDIGTYTLFMCHLLLGRPRDIRAVATLAPTGVDVNCSMALAYDNGATASLFSSIATNTDTVCTIFGSHGSIQIHSRFQDANWVSLRLPDRYPETVDTGRQGMGYHYEAAEVEKCMKAGLLESPLLPLAFSRSHMEMLDEIRRQIGVVYPADRG